MTWIFILSLFCGLICYTIPHPHSPCEHCEKECGGLHYKCTEPHGSCHCLTTTPSNIAKTPKCGSLSSLWSSSHVNLMEDPHPHHDPCAHCASECPEKYTCSGHRHEHCHCHSANYCDDDKLTCDDWKCNNTQCTRCVNNRCVCECQHDSQCDNCPEKALCHLHRCICRSHDYCLHRSSECSYKNCSVGFTPKCHNHACTCFAIPDTCRGYDTSHCLHIQCSRHEMKYCLHNTCVCKPQHYCPQHDHSYCSYRNCQAGFTPKCLNNICTCFPIPDTCRGHDISSCFHIKCLKNETKYCFNNTCVCKPQNFCLEDQECDLVQCPTGYQKDCVNSECLCVYFPTTCKGGNIWNCYHTDCPFGYQQYCNVTGICRCVPSYKNVTVQTTQQTTSVITPSTRTNPSSNRILSTTNTRTIQSTTSTTSIPARSTMSTKTTLKSTFTPSSIASTTVSHHHKSTKLATSIQTNSMNSTTGSQPSQKSQTNETSSVSGAFTGNRPSPTTSTTVRSSALTTSVTSQNDRACPTCDDLLNCKWTYVCGTDETCMIRSVQGFNFTTHCSKRSDCVFIKTVIANGEVYCCDHRDCVLDVLGI